MRPSFTLWNVLSSKGRYQQDSLVSMLPGRHDLVIDPLSALMAFQFYLLKIIF